MNIASVICISSVCLCLAPSFAAVQEKALSPMEHHFFKRIKEFWKDKDFELVKSQILDFLSQHSESIVADNLRAMLGDLYFQEGNYQEALATYRQINEGEYREKTLFKHIRCLEEFGDTDALILTALPYFSDGQSPKIEQAEAVRYCLAVALFEKMQETKDEKTKEKYALRAKPLYLGLASSEHKGASVSALAEIHRVLREYPEACALYEVMAEQDKEQAEEILMLIAHLQMGFDKNKAVETYGRIYQKGGLRAGQAAYNQFVLLYQDGRFGALIEKSGAIQSHLPKEKEPLFHFCLGRSHFALERHADAASFLEQYLQGEAENSEQKKAAFLTLVTCAQKLNDSKLFDRSVEGLLEAFPEDAEAAKALLLHAQTSLKAENLKQAIADLGRLIIQFPDFDQIETILYDRALLLSQTSCWDESRRAFLSFLEEYPNTSHADVIWGYILNCSIQELKLAGPDTMFSKKFQFANDLGIALSREKIFSAEERASYQFLLGKTLYELDRYEEAIPALELAISAAPEHMSVPEAHLLLALSYRENDQCLEQFVRHGEKALASAAPFIDKTALRLHLFNGYIALNDLEKAADHLFTCFAIDNYPIQLDNQLWLANFYYKKAAGSPADADKAALCFQKVLRVEGERMKCTISEENAFLEAEALKLAEILTPKKRLLFLFSLSETQESLPKAPWKLQRQILFELAKAYEAEKNGDEALKIYDRLINTSTHAPSYYSTAAQLCKARLVYSRLKESDKTEKNPKFSHILSTLKDLQIQKRIYSEPLHLEAALEYADIRTKMAGAESRMEAALFFLGRIKDDFLSQDDAASIEYHAARAKSPEKDALFQNYMKCVEAEMLRLEAEIARKEKNMEKAQKAQSSAIALFNELLAASEITPYLRQRAETNLKLMQK